MHLPNMNIDMKYAGYLLFDPDVIPAESGRASKMVLQSTAVESAISLRGSGKRAGHVLLGDRPYASAHDLPFSVVDPELITLFH